GGSHSSTDGGIKKPVSRSIGRKLLMGRISGGGRANRAARFYRSIRFRVKSDRLLGERMHTTRAQLDRIPKLKGTITIETLQHAASPRDRELWLELPYRPFRD